MPAAHVMVVRVRVRVFAIRLRWGPPGASIEPRPLQAGSIRLMSEPSAVSEVPDACKTSHRCPLVVARQTATRRREGWDAPCMSCRSGERSIPCGDIPHAPSSLRSSQS